MRTKQSHAQSYTGKPPHPQLIKVPPELLWMVKWSHHAVILEEA